MVCKLVRRAKTRKRAPKAFKKRENSTPTFIKNDFGEKSIFAIQPLRKPRFLSPRHRNADPEIDQKRPGNKPEQKKIKLLEIKKLIYTGPEITLKSMKILFPTTSCPSCWSHAPPGWSRGAHMVPQGAPEVPKWSQNVNMEAPSPADGNPEEPKGASGRERRP